MTPVQLSLEEQADQFAEDMNRLLLTTITDNVRLRSNRADLEDETLFVVGNEIPLGSHDASSISTLRGERVPVAGLDGVSVAVVWVFTPSSNRRWLKSSTSTFGLWVGDAPFIRLEVDAKKPEGSWLQAHIHVTAESRLLGYLKGLQRMDRTRLDKLHLPVGGFRFRPGLEDFLEFAIDEKLIPGKEGWRDALEPTRIEFRRKQFMAMIADHPDWAREGLSEIETRASEGE